MKLVEVRTNEDIAALEAKVRAAANRMAEILSTPAPDGLALLRQMKFGSFGRHPLEDRPLNFIEQINQTFSCLTSLRAARLLLEWHPEADGLKLVLGPYRGVDIESVRPGLVAAEGFAAVTPDSNDKLKLDCLKMAKHTATHRYVFFHSPRHAEGRFTGPLPVQGVQVWAVQI